MSHTSKIVGMSNRYRVWAMLHRHPRPGALSVAEVADTLNLARSTVTTIVRQNRWHDAVRDPDYDHVSGAGIPLDFTQ